MFPRRKKRHRVAKINFLVDVAKECYNIGNFNSLMAILAGLNLAPVIRLRKTWAKIDREKLNALEHQVSITNQYECVHTLIHTQSHTNSHADIYILNTNTFTKHINLLTHAHTLTNARACFPYCPRFPLSDGSVSEFQQLPIGFKSSKMAVDG